MLFMRFRALLICVVAFPNLLFGTSLQVTAGSAMEKISTSFQRKIHKKDIPRPVSFHREDWPEGTTLLRAAKGQLPILAQPSLVTPKLEIKGIANAGELFAKVSCEQVTYLFNPFGKVSDNGIWCQVQLMNGERGWLMAKADADATWFLNELPSEPVGAVRLTAIIAILGTITLLVGLFIKNMITINSASRPVSSYDHADYQVTASSCDYSDYEDGGVNASLDDEPSDSGIPVHVNMDEYREGYEAGRAAGPVSQLGDAVFSLSYSSDYIAGYKDGHEGRDFNPGKADTDSTSFRII